MMMKLPRTYLFVPGDRPERFAKALASGADAVVVDLEDAVAPAAKDAARATVAQWLGGEAERGRVVVRINDEGAAGYEADVAMLAATGAAAVMLPKAERAETVARLRAACPAIAVLPLVESARGMLAAQALAESPGVQRLVFGTVDYALDLDLGIEPLALDHGHAQLALVSRAAGIAAPVAGVSTALDDEAALLADLARARSHGFGAKLCIHPKQVAPIHRALAPTEAELAWAQRVLQAAGAAAQGAVQLDGRMIDKPVIERARRLIERAAP
jgi:citrate lyase subunit beta/citryl-CoA lyase